MSGTEVVTDVQRSVRKRDPMAVMAELGRPPPSARDRRRSTLNSHSNVLEAVARSSQRIWIGLSTGMLVESDPQGSLVYVLQLQIHKDRTRQSSRQRDL